MKSKNTKINCVRVEKYDVLCVCIVAFLPLGMYRVVEKQNELTCTTGVL
jgi:hypothetical protein